MVSDDEVNWNTIYINDNGTGGRQIPDQNGVPYCVEEVFANGTGRYVRLFMEKCVSGFGVALKDFEVYGQGGKTPKPAERVDLALNKAATASSFGFPTWPG